MFLCWENGESRAGEEAMGTRRKQKNNPNLKDNPNLSLADKRLDRTSGGK
jgi:hypothetical protein